MILEWFVLISTSFALSEKTELWLSRKPAIFSTSILLNFWVSKTNFFSFLRLARRFLISLNNSSGFLFLSLLAISKKDILLYRPVMCKTKFLLRADDNRRSAVVGPSLLSLGKKDSCLAFWITGLHNTWLLTVLWQLYTLSCILRFSRLGSWDSTPW